MHAGVPSSDLIPKGLEVRQLLDVDVDYLTGSAALIATRRRERFDILDPAQPEAAASVTDGGRRDTEFGDGPLADWSLAPQGFDSANDLLQSRMA